MQDGAQHNEVDRGQDETDPQSNATQAQHPFAALTPDTVLSAVESLGLVTDGRLLALNSYENRVYRVGIEDAPAVVAKFYRPARWSNEAIFEEHAFSAELAASEVPVVPPLAFPAHAEHATSVHTTLHLHAGFRFAVFALRGGRAPELDAPDVREWIGRFMGRIHAIGSAATFAHRPSIDVDSFGIVPRDFLLAHDFIPKDLLNAWSSVVDQALTMVEACYARAGSVTSIRLHGDCHLGNILSTQDGPHFVDFDDCRMGPAIQDLWMLLSGSRDEMTVQLRDVLDGYADFADFNPRELHLIEALRTLRILHYAYWLAVRADDPAFLHAFPWFFGDERQRYWQNHVLALREQVAAMQEAPLSIQP
jgi:Ser/Thr protein kinase RdoA (MazF antagonist)